MKIVAPAGSFEKMDAAIKAGANEVYFGLKGFGARRNNKNFGIQEILDGIDYAHSRGVKTLLTLNTLMKDIEIETTLYNLSRIYEHGIDAVIVQDLGFLNFLSKNFPELTLHGSTQMTVANHVEANFLKNLGLSRVVLARELSFEEIKKIRENTDIELEVFVSGSLCIAYSGNCYISSFIGGRSGNRGLCAYTCRKKFKDEAGEEKYFLSPNDQLFEKDEIEKLRSIGIDAIKVEGRKKTEQYVYETVNYYSEILNNNARESESYKLFNRGYSKGYFHSDDKLMNHKYSSNFGYNLGEVIDQSKVKLEDKIMLGDGIQFVDKDYNNIGGIYVNKIVIDGVKTDKASIGEVVYLGKLPLGTKFIFKNFSKEIQDKINHEIKVTDRKLEISGKLTAKIGERLKLSFEAKNLNSEIISAEFEKEVLTEEAKKEIDTKVIKEKVAELGETPFSLGDFEVDYDGKTFFPFSELKQLKRECAEELEKRLLDSYRRNSYTPSIENFENSFNENPVFSALVSNEEQERACRENGITKIYDQQFDVAKENNLEKINLETDFISNLYQMIESKSEKKTIDWNLNIFNNYTLSLFSTFKGVDTVFLSPEMNYEQLKSLKNNKVKKAMVIYGFLKGMYIEYPVFEEDYKEIRGDHYDTYKIINNDLNNVELYMDKPMNLIPKLDEIMELGFDEFRLDFTFENFEETQNIIKSLEDKNGKYNPYCFERGIF